MKTTLRIWLMLVATVAVLCACTSNPAWSAAEMETLEGLWIGRLPALPPGDPYNAYADDEGAAELGHALFFDARLSANGAVSCATCHPPESNFRDRLPRSQGVGTSKRRSLSVVGAAYSPWFFWDGRKDSLWSQALEPLEDPAEHGITRMQAARLVSTHYRAEYERIFGALPDFSDAQRFPAAASPLGDEAARLAWEGMRVEDRAAVNRVFANLGKAIAAYERLLVPAPSRFDAYVAALLTGDEVGAQNTLTKDEIAGLRLFIGQAGCVNCHNGPLFTNQDFHNTGVPQDDAQALDAGRLTAIERLRADEFNCLGEFSDAKAEDCQELRFVLDGGAQIEGGFKPPSLRNVAKGGPYMHNGQMKTLREVLEHYNRAPSSQFEAGYSELIPLRLSNRQLEQLEAFLGSLSAPLQVEARWLRPQEENHE